jgi:hypothetical protein
MNAAVKFALVLVGLVIVGWIAWALLKAIFGLLFYLIVGALVVGAAYLLYKKAAKSLGSPRKKLPRV